MAGSGSNRFQNKDPHSPSASQSETAAHGRRCRILLVEDNKADVFLIREAIVAANPGADLHVVPDGERAIKLFQQMDSDDSLPVPDLVIIDINLPRKHGSEVLAGMRKSRRLANTMALAITSSESERDRDRMAALGISEYFQKPSEYNEFMKLGDIVAALLARAAGLEER